MFILIENKNAHEYRDDIQLLNKAYLQETGAPIAEQNPDGSFLYLFCKHEDHGIIGGAKITSDLTGHGIQDYFLKNGFQINDSWLIEHVIFTLESNSAVHDDGDAFDKLCGEFYKGLYESFSQIHSQYKKDVILTLNSIEEHEDIKFYGEWPFLAEHKIELEDSGDEAVLGVLRLSATS